MKHLSCDLRVLRCDANERFRRSGFAEPKADTGLVRFVTVLVEVRIDEPPDHGPVFVALCLLGLHQVLDAKQFIDDSFGVLNGGSASPERFEIVTAPHLRHHVKSDTGGVTVLATEVDRVPAIQVAPIGRWNCNAVGLQFIECRREAIQVRFVGDDHNVTVSAKLGRAVEYACLPAHKQVPDLVA